MQSSPNSDYTIARADPLGPDALALLSEAAAEARRLYVDLIPASTPIPVNTPLVLRSDYLLAYDRGRPVGCGALWPIDADAAELQRMYVIQAQRRKGIAQALLTQLEAAARHFGYITLRLETGVRQQPAMSFYESNGFHRIPPFGCHITDPTSVCYEKSIRSGASNPTENHGRK